MSFLPLRSRSASKEMSPVFEFFSSYRANVPEEDVLADLTFGNPHEMPLPGPLSARFENAYRTEIGGLVRLQDRARKSRAG